ncbi:MAG: hypothetical protein LC109_03135 [Bacteroidia bacterium]|nr:hypothetical protein [Bacteroidia bacterium]
MINSNLPESSKVHIYPADAPLDQQIQNTIVEKFKAFLHNWNYHGTPLQTDVFFLSNQFMVLVVDDNTVPGGCSLDVLSRFVTKLENEVGIKLNNRHNIYIKRNEKIISVPFNKTSGFGLEPEDKIVNLLCANLADIQHNLLKSPTESDYARLFSA